MDSPVVCIATKEGLSLNMENVLDEQLEKTQQGEKPKARKVLEINPDHDLWKAIAGVGMTTRRPNATALYFTTKR